MNRIVCDVQYLIESFWVVQTFARRKRIQCQADQVWQSFNASSVGNAELTHIRNDMRQVDFLPRVSFRAATTRGGVTTLHFSLHAVIGADKPLLAFTLWCSLGYAMR